MYDTIPPSVFLYSWLNDGTFLDFIDRRLASRDLRPGTALARTTYSSGVHTKEGGRTSDASNIGTTFRA
jgi:hypothetical protein